MNTQHKQEKKMDYVIVDLQLFAINVPANLVQQTWAREAMKAAMKNIFFSKFTGTSNESIIQIKEDLRKNRGDKIWIRLLLKLKSAPITGDAMLEGNEDDLTYADFGVSIDQERWAVRSTGKMEEQKSNANMYTDAKDALQMRIEEWLDQLIFEKLTATPTPNRVLYAGGKTSAATITTADKFDTSVIGKAKRMAQMADPIIRPVRVNGGNYYVMVIDPYQARDLKSDEKWFNAQKDANLRGEKNPIFTGALGMWDKVIVHESETCPRTTDGADGGTVGHALFLGPQAAVFARAQSPRWIEDTFDYKNQWGVAIAQIMGIEKTKYNIEGVDTDFACINVLTSSAGD